MERNFDFCSEMLTSGGFARRTDGEYDLSVSMRLVQFEKKDIIINCYKGPQETCNMGCFIRTPGTDDWELLAATYCPDVQKFTYGGVDTDDFLSIVCENRVDELWQKFYNYDIEKKLEVLNGI